MRTLCAFLRIVRFPAVFTVVADVVMGIVLIVPTAMTLSADDVQIAEFWPVWLTILLASICFYWSGMIFNDVADADRDGQSEVYTRQQRPIPSGQVSRNTATGWGIALMALGIVAAVGLSVYLKSAYPIISAVVLVALILLYDFVMKFHALGPIVMGLCRSANIAFAFCWYPLTMGTWQQIPQGAFLVAVAIGVYIAGVTWFAKFENPEYVDDSATKKILSVLAIMAGVLMLIPVCQMFPPERVFIVFSQEPARWRLLLGVLSLMIGLRAFQAVLGDNPQAIATITGYCLMTLIVLDAVLVCLVQGPYFSVCVVALLLPAIVTNRLTYIT